MALLEEPIKEVKTIKNFINGEWVESKGEIVDVVNPATCQTIARVPISTKEEIDTAVEASKEAFPDWRATPPVARARCLFRLKELLEENFEEVSRIQTQEHGKTIDESRGETRRGIENVEVACGIPTLMQGYHSEDIASGIDEWVIRQPLGVFGIIGPYNFPWMIPLWSAPYAVATGNCVIIKPSSEVPNSQTRLAELVDEAGFPPGVWNVVNGGRTAVPSLMTSFFGNAGQRCLSGQTLIIVGEDDGFYNTFMDAVTATTKGVIIGSGLDESVQMGPLRDKEKKESILGYIESGIQQGAKIRLDGRENIKIVGDYPDTCFLGPTILENVTPDMKVVREEIFGPTMGVMRVKTLGEAIEICNENPYHNADAIFTSDGKSAREFQYRVKTGDIGINIGIVAPMAFFPFSGMAGSFYGVLHTQGQEAVRFFTESKVVIQRWL
jgi:malonate-semialdehyde dehydrogenase (acetylating)/methylmalonate-semialdehyde dehydrogenase